MESIEIQVNLQKELLKNKTKTAQQRLYTLRLSNNIFYNHTP